MTINSSELQERKTIRKEYPNSPALDHDLKFSQNWDWTVNIIVERSLWDIKFNNIPKDKIDMVLSYFQSDSFSLPPFGGKEQSYSEIKDKLIAKEVQGTWLADEIKTQKWKIELQNLSFETLVSITKEKLTSWASDLEQYELKLWEILVKNPNLIPSAISSLGKDVVRDRVINGYFMSSKAFVDKFNDMYENYPITQDGKEVSLDDKQRKIIVWKVAIKNVFGLSDDNIDSIYKNFYENWQQMANWLSDWFNLNQQVQKLKSLDNGGLVWSLKDWIDSTNAPLRMKKHLKWVATAAPVLAMLGVAILTFYKFWWKWLLWLWLTAIVAEYATWMITGRWAYDWIKWALYWGLDSNSSSSSASNTARQLVTDAERGSADNVDYAWNVGTLLSTVWEIKFSDIRSYLKVDWTNLKFNAKDFVGSIKDDTKKTMIQWMISTKEWEDNFNNMVVSSLAKIWVNSNNYDKVDWDKTIHQIVLEDLKKKSDWANQNLAQQEKKVTPPKKALVSVDDFGWDSAGWKPDDASKKQWWKSLIDPEQI